MTSTEEMVISKGLTAPRVTPAQIDELSARVFYNYHQVGTSTFCHAFLDNRFLLATGHSACVSMENFDEGIGRKIAFDDATVQLRDKLWELEGYRLYCQLNEVK